MNEKLATIAMLRTPRHKLWKIKLEEFKLLAKTQGYTIVNYIVQYKQKPKVATLFGKGKLQEIKEIIQDHAIDYLLVYNTLTSMQKLNLERILRVNVLDRYDLVLEIFASNASDSISKLQIELAKLKKVIPYLKLQTSLLHYKDRPFFKAGGEYAWNPKLAILRRRMKLIRKQIEKYREDKIKQILHRRSLGFIIVCLVGYYNAGKTSLFNLLTGENKSVSASPFTTLSSKYSKFKNFNKILLVDTIGFISDLDPRIIASFELNLEDIVYSDVLCLVIDSSDPVNILENKLNSTIQILRKIYAIRPEKKIITILNKIDLIKDPYELASRKQIVQEILQNSLNISIDLLFLSSKTGDGISILIDHLVRLVENGGRGRI